MTNGAEGGASVSATVAPHGDVSVVSLGGELDLANSGALRSLLEEQLTAAGSALVVDLTSATFMDSTALGVLVRIRKLARADGRGFAVVCPTGPVLRLLSITRLEDVFGVRGTLADALSSVNDA